MVVMAECFPCPTGVGAQHGKQVVDYSCKPLGDSRSFARASQETQGGSHGHLDAHRASGAHDEVGWNTWERRPSGYGGADINPAWVHNLRANPTAHIEIGTESFDAVARELPPAERDEIVPKITEILPVFAEYQAKTSRVIPIFHLQKA